MISTPLLFKMSYRASLLRWYLVIVGLFLLDGWILMKNLPPICSSFYARGLRLTSDYFRGKRTGMEGWTATCRRALSYPDYGGLSFIQVSLLTLLPIFALIYTYRRFIKHESHVKTTRKKEVIQNIDGRVHVLVYGTWLPIAEWTVKEGPTGEVIEFTATGNSNCQLGASVPATAPPQPGTPAPATEPTVPATKPKPTIQGPRLPSGPDGCPHKPASGPTRTPESAMPGSLLRVGAMPENEFIFGIKVEGTTVPFKHSRGARFSHNGRKLTFFTRHGLARLRGYSVEEIMICTAKASDHSGATWIPYTKAATKYLLNPLHPSDLLRTATCLADVDVDAAQVDYVCTLGDLVCCEPPLNFALMGVTSPKLAPSFSTEVSATMFYTNPDTGAQGKSEGFIEVDEDAVRSLGYINHSCTAYPSCSGGQISEIASPQFLVGIHLGNNKKGPKNCSNVAIPGRVVYQLAQLHCKEEWRPNYTVAFNLATKEMGCTLREFDSYFDQLTICHEAKSTLEASGYTTQFTAEAAVSRKMWKGLLRHLHKSGQSKADIKNFLYNKTSGKMPMWDPNYTKREYEALNEIWEDEILAKIYGGDEEYYGHGLGEASRAVRLGEVLTGEFQSTRAIMDALAPNDSLQLAGTMNKANIVSALNKMVDSGLVQRYRPDDGGPTLYRSYSWTPPTEHIAEESVAPPDTTKPVETAAVAEPAPPKAAARTAQPEAPATTATNSTILGDAPAIAILAPGALESKVTLQTTSVEQPTIATAPEVVPDVQAEAANPTPPRKPTQARKNKKKAGKPPGLDLEGHACDIPSLFDGLCRGTGGVIAYKDTPTAKPLLKRKAVDEDLSSSDCTPESHTQPLRQKMGLVNKSVLDQMAEFDKLFEDFERPLPCIVKELTQEFNPVTSDECNRFDLLIKSTLADIDNITFGEFMANCESSFPGCAKGHFRESWWFQTYLSKTTTLRSGKGADRQDTRGRDSLRFVGKAPTHGSCPSTKMEMPPPEAYDFLRKAGMIDDEGNPTGVWPARGPNAVHDSLKYQLGRKNPDASVVSKEHLAQYSEGFPAISSSKELKLRQIITQAIDAVDDGKSAAWSTCYGTQTKGDFCRSADCIPVTVVTLALKMVTDPATLLQWSPHQRFQAGLMDPEDTFVKKEIHPWKKAMNGRWRIIWNGSVRMELLDRILHSEQNSVELVMYQTGQTHTPDYPTFGSAAGMGHHDEGIQTLIDAFKRLGIYPEGTCLDASGWDITLSLAMILCDGWRRAYLALSGGAPMAFARALMNRAITMASHLVKIGVDVFEVCMLGIIGSGLFSTAASNSFIRGFTHSSAYWSIDDRISLSLDMGDDCVSPDEVLDTHLEFWHKMGLIMDPDDQGDVAEDGYVEFTSHEFDIESKTATFANGKKLMMRLAFAGLKGLTTEQVGGVLFALRHTPDIRQQVKELLLDLEQRSYVAAGTFDMASNLPLGACCFTDF